MRYFRGKKQSFDRLAFSRDGRYLAGTADLPAGPERLLQVWDTAGRDIPIRMWKCEYWHWFAFTPDGRLFISWYDYGTRLDVRSGQRVEEGDPNGFDTV